DGTRLDLLRRAGGEEANVIAFCIDDPSFSADTLEPIAQAFPQAALFVRAFDRRQLIALDGVDLAGVTREVFESAIRMGVEVLASLGLPEEDIVEVERQYRENDRERLDRQIAGGNLLAAKHLMYGPGRRMVLSGDAPLGDNA
ncbi:MAG TPA: sodium:proton exchanger, partial [Sphingobium sp.]|nr:sodium:proton exchanger [Sphingobium sp.]